MRRALWVVVFLMVSAGAARAQTEKVLLDFEGADGLAGTEAVYGAKIELSRDHVARGKQSLKMMLPERPYPGFKTVVTQQDWSRYDTLNLDLHVEGDQPVWLGLWLKSPKSGALSRRFNYRQKLPPGDSRVSIPCDVIWHPARKVLWGTIDRGEVSELSVYVRGLARPLNVYVDAIRLVREDRKTSPAKVPDSAKPFDGSMLFDFRNMHTTGRSSGFFVDLEIPLVGGRVRKVSLSKGKPDELRFWLTDRQLSGYRAGSPILVRAHYLDNYETPMCVRRLTLAAGQTVYARYAPSDF